MTSRRGVRVEGPRPRRVGVRGRAAGSAWGSAWGCAVAPRGPRGGPRGKTYLNFDEEEPHGHGPPTSVSTRPIVPPADLGDQDGGEELPESPPSDSRPERRPLFYVIPSSVSGGTDLPARGRARVACRLSEAGARELPGAEAREHRAPTPESHSPQYFWRLAEECAETSQNTQKKNASTTLRVNHSARTR